MFDPRLILALDYSKLTDIICIADAAADHISTVKIGLEPFIHHGPGLVKIINELDLDVFLDLKLFDIPRTVEAAVKGAVDLGCSMITIHSAAGPNIMEAAVDAADGNIDVLAVTTLTSENASDKELLRAVTEAEEAGCDAIVCSGKDLKLFKKLNIKKVCPGIRLAEDAWGDQKRVTTPGEAIDKGADYIVVGRPITEADDPVAAIKNIIRDM